MLTGDPVALGIGNSVMVPSSVMRPTRLPSTWRLSARPLSSTNHMLPSAPAVMSPGPRSAPGSMNSVTVPSSVIRPILPALNSENQMLPSGPAASARGPLFGVGIANSVITPCGRDASDLAAHELTEPHVAVAPERRRARLAVRRRDVEFGDHARRRDAAHAVAEVLGEPEIAVRPDRDDPRRAAGVRQVEFLDRRCRRAPSGRCGCRSPR